MVKPIDLAQIIKTNPRIDPDKLKEELELYDKLSEMGLGSASSRIPSPIERHKARVMDSKGQRHTVQLRKL